MIFSCIIPVSNKDRDSQFYKDLVYSIYAQNFDQKEIEILAMGEEHGDSEQAKAAGIRNANGDICVMLCADNYLVDNSLFNKVNELFKAEEDIQAIFPCLYHYHPQDNSLNRYFSLIGGNDPICYYLGKNDRFPHVNSIFKKSSYPPSFGCNGFFYRKKAIQKTNLDNYYPMDNALEVDGDFAGILSDGVWHRTSENLITFLKKRYRYAKDLYCDRTNRRWKMVDTLEDRLRLCWFVISTLTVIPALSISIRGYSKIKDPAFFWHWPVCFGFLITYGLLAFRNLFRYGTLFQCPQN